MYSDQEFTELCHLIASSPNERRAANAIQMAGYRKVGADGAAEPEPERPITDALAAGKQALADMGKRLTDGARPPENLLTDAEETG